MGRGMFIAAGLLLGLAPARAEAPLAALSALEPGQWTLRSPDHSGPARSLCLGDPRALLQIRHTGAQCSRFVIANDANQTVVHYTCPGAGHARTTVRVETPQLAQVMTQGIADGGPFDWSYEARRTGACAAR